MGPDRPLAVLFFLFSFRNIVECASKPNILFLVVDDLRPKLGCYGESNMATPNIDNLARKSVRFERAYVQQALCNPSRSSFLTSRRPDTTRIFDLVTYFRHISDNFTTFPEHFKNNGYITQSVGKIFHPGAASGGTDDYPYSWTFPAYHAPTEKNMLGKVCPGTDGKLHRYFVCPVANLSQVPGGSLPDIQNADFAIKFLEERSKNSDQPFLLAVGFHKPHLPFRYPQKYQDLYPLSKIQLAPDKFFPSWLPAVAWNDFYALRSSEDVGALHMSWPYGPMPDDFQLKMIQSYSAATSYTDAQVGRVLEALDKAGFADNTIISFHGDHGWSLGEHEEWCKHSNFEIARRIPLMFYVPGTTADTSFERPGKTFPFVDVLESLNEGRERTGERSMFGVDEDRGLSTNAFAEAVDIFPTLSELAGLTVPPLCPPSDIRIPLCTEGVSLVPVIKNITQPNPDLKWKTAVFGQYPRPSYFPQNNTDNPVLDDIRIMGYVIQTDEYRYTEWVSYDPRTFLANWTDLHARELYIYQSDPLEDWNMADVSTHTSLVAQLSKQLRAGWRAALPSRL